LLDTRWQKPMDDSGFNIFNPSSIEEAILFTRDWQDIKAKNPDAVGGVIISESLFIDMATRILALEQEVRGV